MEIYKIFGSSKQKLDSTKAKKIDIVGFSIPNIDTNSSDIWGCIYEIEILVHVIREAKIDRSNNGARSILVFVREQWVKFKIANRFAKIIQLRQR